MSRTCEYCGTSLPEGAKACPACGGPVTEKKPPSMVVNRQIVTPQIGKNANRKADERPDIESRAGQPAMPQQEIQISAPREAYPVSDQKPQKSHKGISVFLALIFFVELGVAAFWHPGFLSRVRTVSTVDNPYVKVIDTSTESESKRLMRAVSPGNPANLTVIPDEKKIAKIHPVTGQVSPENPVCTAGDITADFGMWNLEEEDTFEVRSLGTADDDANNSTCVMYDLSLTSGRHEFDTAVTVRIPRAAGEYDGKIVHYNDELQEWEPTAFEVSEDRKWYSVRLYHFSPVSEVFSKETKRVSLETVNASNVSMFSAVESKTSFYMKAGGGREWVTTKYPMLQMPITLNEESFYYLIKEVKIENLEPEYIRNLVRQGRIDNDYFMSVMLSTLGTGFDIGGQVTGLFGGELADAISMTGLLFTSAKLMNDLKNEPDTAKVIEKDWGDIVSMFTTAAGFYPPASMACYIFGVLLYYIQKGIIYVEDHNPMDMQDAVYRYYMNRHSGGLAKEDDFLKLTGKGWPMFINDIYEKNKNLGTLKNLEAEIEGALDTYVESFWLYMDEADRRSICNEARDQYSYLLLEEPLSAQYYLEMEGGWEEPAKAYPAEYMRNAKDILCRNLKGTFEALALKYLDETENQLKKEIYSKILPELNEYMIFEIKSDAIGNYLESPYVDKTPFVVDGNYVFSTLYPYSYSDKYKDSYKNAAMDDKLTIRFAPDLKAFFRPYEVNVLFKPLNMQNYDFSASYVPHARFNYEKTANYTRDADFIMLHGWIYDDVIELKTPENIVFVCKKYYYLMVGCPEAMQIKDPRNKQSSWVDCKLKAGEKGHFWMYDLPQSKWSSAIYTDSMKGMDQSAYYQYIYVIPGAVPEEKKEEKSVTYNMVLAADNLMSYNEPSEEAKNGDWLEYTKYGADNTFTVTGNKCEASIPGVNYVWVNKSIGGNTSETTVTTYDVQYSYIRGSVTLSGTLEEEWTTDDGVFMKFTLDNPPSVSGSHDTEYLYNQKGKEYGLHYKLTEKYMISAPSGGYIRLQFNTKRTKLLKAVVSIGGNGTYTWDYNNTPVSDMIVPRGSESFNDWTATFRSE